jgi:hypothetical protein
MATQATASGRRERVKAEGGKKHKPAKAFAEPARRHAGVIAAWHHCIVDAASCLRVFSVAYAREFRLA